MQNDYFLSKICSNAKLLRTLSSVAKELECYPGLVRIRRGTTLAYLIGREAGDCFYTVELSKDAIALTIHSKASPVYYFQEALLRLLSIFSILEEFYVVDLRSIYPYLINVLGASQLGNLVDKSDKDGSRWSGIESILAKRINSLLSQNAALQGSLEEKERKLDLLLSRFIIAKYGGTVDLDTAAKDIHVESTDIEKAIKNMESLGYKGVRVGERRFSLMRA